MSVREVIRTTRWTRWVLIILAVLLLGACVPQYSRRDWAGLVSTTDALRFIAPASCDTPNVFDPVAPDAGFSKVNRLEPVRGEPWTHNIEFVGNEGVRRGRFVIKQWWSGAGIKAAPSSVTTDHKFCNVLAEIPVSRDGRHPYYVEPEAAKTAEHDSLTPVTPTSVFLLVLVGTALFLSFWGFEYAHQWCSWASILLAMTGVSIVLYYFCVEAPWHEYQQALAYLKWFDQLPRTASGDLLPISPQQLAYIVAGPTHPQSTEFHFEVFAWVASVLIGLWLIATGPFVVMGVYWLAVPLPLEELHQHTLRAGRAPTTAEITAAVLSACTGKAAWQHRIMQRKVEAFTRNIREINRHLYGG